MRAEYDNELTTEQREKMKKNLIYVGIFSIVMIFAGFTSAYIVSMGDSFWVKYNFPPAFYVSTALILLSSASLIFAVSQGKKGNTTGVKAGVTITLLLGIGFAWFQLKGYSQLFERGANPVNRILVSKGRYGNYYQLKIDGKYMDVNGNEYLIAGKQVSESQKKAISEFAGQLVNIQKRFPEKINNYGKYTLLYKNQELRLENGRFYLPDSSELQYVDLDRMAWFAIHLRDGRGDFFLKGTMGKDFHIYYQGSELSYKDRSLYFGEQKLEGAMQMDAESSADNATSFLFIITFLHLLHVAVTLFYMLSLSIRSFTGTLERHNYISLRMGAIFWHFLGALWVYLLLFLLFIH